MFSPSCNLRESNRVEMSMADDHAPVPFFNPRSDNWSEHFGWEKYQIIGLTPVGRATVESLLFNHERRVRIRQAEALFGLFPPNDVKQS